VGLVGGLVEVSKGFHEISVCWMLMPFLLDGCDDGVRVVDFDGPGADASEKGKGGGAEVVA